MSKEAFETQVSEAMLSLRQQLLESSKIPEGFPHLVRKLLHRATEQFAPYEHAFVVIGHEEESTESGVVRVTRLVGMGPFREHDAAIQSANRHRGPAVIIGPVVVREVPV